MSKPQRKQCAAIPFRIVGGSTQVMLVTSRETRRWILPKGWTKKKLRPDVMAAREAFEEAGVLGDVAPDPVGGYRYLKRMPDGASIRCDVAVFLLQVTDILDEWPEMEQRVRRWMSIRDAAALISDPELAPLLRQLGGENEGTPGVGGA